MSRHLSNLSVEQARLEAVLLKMGDLVPFVQDQECERVLKVVREVVDAAMRRKDDEKKAQFHDMPLTDLLGITEKKGMES